MNFLSKGPAFQTKLRLIREQANAAYRNPAPPPRIPDPWEVVLSDLVGEVHEAIERIPTHHVFEHPRHTPLDSHFRGRPPASSRDAACWMGDRALASRARNTS